MSGGLPDAQFQAGIQRLLRLQRIERSLVERRPELAGAVAVAESSATHLTIAVPAGRIVLAYERAGTGINWVIADSTELERPTRFSLDTSDDSLVEAW